MQTSGCRHCLGSELAKTQPVVVWKLCRCTELGHSNVPAQIHRFQPGLAYVQPAEITSSSDLSTEILADEHINFQATQYLHLKNVKT